MKGTKTSIDAAFVTAIGISCKFSCLVCVLILFFSGCGTPSLLQTAEIRGGFSITMKLSCSLADEEVVDTWSGDDYITDDIGEIPIWVMPKFAIGVCPTWERGGHATGIDIEWGGLVLDGVMRYPCHLMHSLYQLNLF